VTSVKVAEVMMRDVITVTPESSLKAVAETLTSHRISGVPVVDGGRVLGIVSEADILEKEAAKKAARTAREAMNSPAVTV
jgi:CBS domain-containing protein